MNSREERRIKQKLLVEDCKCFCRQALASNKDAIRKLKVDGDFHAYLKVGIPLLEETWIRIRFLLKSYRN